MKRRRAAVPEAEARAAGAAVARAVLALAEVEAAGRVAIYAALPGELPTRPLLDGLRARDRTPLFPRFAGDRLEFAAAERFEDLAPGRYGVAEPTGPAVATGPGDAVVVPGLAFDGAGRRLGRGGGFFDRTFPPGEEGPFLVGVGYHFQCVALVPAGPEDRRLDAVATERGAFRCGGEAPADGPREETEG